MNMTITASNVRPSRLLVSILSVFFQSINKAETTDSAGVVTTKEILSLSTSLALSLRRNVSQTTLSLAEEVSTTGKDHSRSDQSSDIHNHANREIRDNHARNKDSYNIGDHINNNNYI
ncbi:hypothetical protein BC939DRAFT_501621 [Gamsiella multidivaricata]|uniref:uncharacterized protein n=1 Tax=Gamsiella multidivaricata TaxID=101098 RepID=UPI00221EFAB3|nr:uncharacterized protein BC939DRAFT_501621 [Gamsiella multidivaricata]KAI7826972.1 hypothetical protein BC939DRAFT_501621 [Gamsiella multidivaricata]